MKRPLVLALPLFLLAAVPAGAAAPRRAAVRYSIELTDGARWIAADAPVVRDTVATFHTPDGTLTGVPREMVVRVTRIGSAGLTAEAARSLPTAPETTEGAAVATEALEPGETLLLGPLTEVGPTLAESNAASAAANRAAAGGVVAGAPSVVGHGGAYNPNVHVNPNGTLSRAPSTTDLAQALAAQTQVGSNGSPLTSSGAPTVIGPDGMPTLAPGVPGSSTPAIGPNGTPIIGETGPSSIGPNGTPVLAPTGQPGSEQTVIGANGTPVLAPAGQPGSTPVVIGPNGTPELAPTVATGSTPVVIGPNGTPVLASSGQPGSTATVIGPNGTPVLAPSGQPGSLLPNTAPNGTPASVPMRSGATRSGNAGGRGR